MRTARSQTVLMSQLSVSSHSRSRMEMDTSRIMRVSRTYLKNDSLHGDVSTPWREMRRTTV